MISDRSAITSILRTFQQDGAVLRLDLPGERLSIEARLAAVSCFHNRLALTTHNPGMIDKLTIETKRVRARAHIGFLEAIFVCEEPRRLPWPGSECISVPHPHSMLLIGDPVDRTHHFVDHLLDKLGSAAYLRDVRRFDCGWTCNCAAQPTPKESSSTTRAMW